MNRTVAGWITAVVGVVLFASGAPSGQAFRTVGLAIGIAGAGLVMLSHLGRERTDWWPTVVARPSHEEERRHARIASGRVILRLRAIFGPTLGASSLTTPPAGDAAGWSLGRMAGTRPSGPALYGAAAAVAVASLVLILGQPSYGPDGERSGTDANPAQAKSMPELVTTPTETSQPTSSPDSAPRAELGAALSAGKSEAATPKTAAPGEALGAPVGPQVETSSPPGETTPEPDPDSAPTPEPTASASPTPLPTSTPKPIPPPDDDEGKCLLYVGLPSLLDLCLLGRL